MDLRDYTKWRNNTLNARLETDKKYIVLKMGGYLISSAGLGWYILYTLMGIRYGVENGFIPVVDWRDCKLPQYNANKVGKENVWEYFFEQPLNITVDQAYASGDFFVVDDVRKLQYKDSLNAENFKNFYDENAVKWRRYCQSYVRLKKEIQKYFENSFKQHIENNEKFIGVLARGTDYRELKPVGHLKAVYEEEIFSWIDQLQRPKSRYNIFLATEDKNILANFEKKYPEKVYSVETVRYENLGHDTLNLRYNKEDGYDRDIKYLYAIYAISKCPICIYSACGGGILASLLRKEEGDSYHFLCHGYNRATGMIIGSSIEKEKEKMILMGGKPMMFYALNTLKLLHVKEVYIVVTEKVKLEYQRLIGYGEEFGFKIQYVVSDIYNIVSHIVETPQYMKASKMVLLYADCFTHGIGISKELLEKVYEFDGAYVWGTKNFVSKNVESIEINKETGIPKRASINYISGNYSLLGKYVFDVELKEILVKLQAEKEVPTITDILNEYINRKKLFFMEYKRGTVFSRIENMQTLEKTGKMINLLEELQNEKIGDFEGFRERL